MGIIAKLLPPEPLLQRIGTRRLDGWENQLTGIGVSGKDKRLGATITPEALTQTEAEGVWRGDDMADRMVVTVPNEMLRAGFYVDVPDDWKLSEEIDAILREMGLADKLLRALYYSRAYGGGALIPGADDGKTPDVPLNEKTISEVTHVNAFTPDELYATEWFVDPFAPKYGMPRMYELVPIQPGNRDGAQKSEILEVHESRIVRLDGQVTSPEHLRGDGNELTGWGDSIFVRVLKVIRDFQSVWDGAALLMQDFAPPVLKMKGLAELLAAAKANPNGLSIRDRLAAVEVSRSIARLVLLDKDEEFKRETTNIAGLPEMLEKFMARLASAADMPVSLLVGQAPAGLNATGDSEIRWFYDRVASLQKRVLEPAIRRVVQMIFLSKSGPTKGKVPTDWEICFNPLWQLSGTEQADVDLKEAQKLAALVGANIITPEEAAKSIERKIEIDFDAREKLMQEYESSVDETRSAKDPETGAPLSPPSTPALPPRPYKKD